MRSGSPRTVAASHVAVQLDLTVKIAFITVYRYEQTGQDDWQDDVLVRTRIRPIDDGKETLVVAESREGKLVVEGPTGTLRDHPRRHDRPQLLERGDHPRHAGDRQSDRRADQDRVQPRRDETISARPDDLDATFPDGRTKGRSGTVWYDDAGGLVKAIVLTRGETLTYELAA